MRTLADIERIAQSAWKGPGTISAAIESTGIRLTSGAHYVDVLLTVGDLTREEGSLVRMTLQPALDKLKALAG
jgi:hypothetical protein